jgi:hemerythrin superfamily protein
MAGATEDPSTNGADVPDILESLMRDHRSIEQLLERFEAIPGTRADWFCHVRETLVRHEVAEEMVVYPSIRHRGDPDRTTIESRIREQADSEKVLVSLDHLDPESSEFAEGFIALRTAVLAHAGAEESTIFPAIEGQKSVEERRMLGQRYERAKQAAPTHPHPHAPDHPPGNLVLGPIAAFADRLRDAARNDNESYID